MSANSSDAGDGNIDGDETDECVKVMKLRAPDVNTRIIWVTMIERILQLYHQ